VLASRFAFLLTSSGDRSSAYVCEMIDYTYKTEYVCGLTTHRGHAMPCDVVLNTRVMWCQTAQWCDIRMKCVTDPSPLDLGRADLGELGAQLQSYNRKEAGVTCCAEWPGDVVGRVMLGLLNGQVACRGYAACGCVCSLWVGIWVTHSKWVSEG